MKKQLVIIVAILMLLFIGLSGCTNREGTTLDNQETIDGETDIVVDSDGDDVPDVDDNCPHIFNPDQLNFDQDDMGDVCDNDDDNDGTPDYNDPFQFDSTQWADRDGDRYGDNPNGINPDAFPDDPAEWKDSDNDNIGDNADIYDMGNGGIKIKITRFQGDDISDEMFSKIDPYFKIQIYVIEKGDNDWKKIGEGKSQVYDNKPSILNPYSYAIDIKDDIKLIHVIIGAWDEDIDADDCIDLNGDSTIRYDAEIDFNPKIQSYKSFISDGRLDLLDELDGQIEYTIQIIEI